MNRLLLIPIIFFTVVIGITACKKNNLGIDRDPVQAPSLAEFAYYNAAFAKDYYVLSTNNVFKVPVGITNVSSTDRTVQLSYTSTNATNGTQYTAPTSITIKAGQALDSLTIAGNYNNLTPGTPYLVKIKITGGDVPAFAGKDSVMLTIRKYCNVVLANLAGAYTSTYEQFGTPNQYGPYTTTLTNVVSTGATSATAKIVNLYDDDWQPINISFDWSNAAAFKVNVAQQPTGSAGSVKQVRASTSGVNTFSSCDRSITLGLDLLNGSGAVLASNYKFLLK